MKRLAEESAFEPENERQREALAFLRLTDSQASAPFPGVGDRVADFVIEQELGRGGAGVVYRAQQVNLGRSVALKLIPHGPAALTEAYARRLEREGRMLASVKHESIPTVHAAGVVPGFHYVAVDLVDGTTLKELIHGRASGFPRPGDPRWLPFLLGLLRGVAGALAAAHARGIVHRDVKPGNVLVDREGRPFLVDFGLAREEGVTGATLTHGFVGTPQYASPEQVRGEPLGVASDVFSFGVLAFEAVSGERPFRGESAHGLASEILSADPQWPAVPRDLRAVIDRCLEKRPARRYADAREIEAEFARLLRFEPVLAVPRGPFAQAWRSVRRHPVRATAGLGVLVACLGVSTTFLHAKWVSIRKEALESRITEVLRLFGPGKFDEYRKGLDELLEEEDVPIRVYGRRADLHLLEERPEPELAAPLYRRCLEGGSKDLADHVGYLATRAVAEGRTWKVTLADAPSPATTNRDFMVLALAHEMHGDIPAALAAITQAIDKGPLPVELHFIRMRYLRKLGLISQLATELELACQLRSSDRRLPIAYAQTLHRLHRYEDEDRFLRARLEIDPGDARVLAELAFCSSRLGRGDAALEFATRARALAPAEGRVVEALASSFLSRGRHEDARNVLAEAARTMPDDPHVLSSAARLALETGDLAEASRLAETLAAIDARDERWPVLGLELHGRVQSARGAYPEAIAAFQELEAREPEVMDWPLAIGVLLERTGDLIGAEAAIERALALGPIEPQALWAKASLLRATGRPRDALRVLGPGLWRPADAGTTYYWMAVTWLELGQPGAALYCAQEAARAGEGRAEHSSLLARCEAAVGADAGAALRDSEAGARPREAVER